MESIIIICIFVLLVAWKIWISLPKNIGKYGEIRVARKLDWLSKEYITLNDVLLPTHYGTTQIDHIYNINDYFILPSTTGTVIGLPTLVV